MVHSQAHSFHIPVMGLAFTIDSPLKVARCGINSVVSIIEDHLIEIMREVICRNNQFPYTPILENEKDARARRIKAYLNLMDEVITSHMALLARQNFDTDTEINTYFDLLPNVHPLRAKYRELKNSSGPAKLALAEWLKTQLLPGSIEVNIMTKCDRPNFDENDEALPQEYSDALSALRGYANSNLRSSIIFSAGMNPRVFSYCAKFHDFFPDVDGDLKKQIVLKVSDYRSANVLSPEQLRLRNMAQTAQLIIQDTIKHPETKSAKEQLEY